MYLDVKSHGFCNVLSNGSEKKYLEMERWQWQNVHKMWNVQRSYVYHPYNSFSFETFLTIKSFFKSKQDGMADRFSFLVALGRQEGYRSEAVSALHPLSWYFWKPLSQRPGSPSRESSHCQERNAPTPNSKLPPCFEVTWPCFWKKSLGPMDSWITSQIFSFRLRCYCYFFFFFLFFFLVPPRHMGPPGPGSEPPSPP